MVNTYQPSIQKRRTRSRRFVKVIDNMGNERFHEVLDDNIQLVQGQSINLDLLGPPII